MTNTHRFRTLLEDTILYSDYVNSQEFQGTRAMSESKQTPTHGPDSFPIFGTIDSVLGGKNRVFEICDVFPVELLLHSSQSSPKQRPKISFYEYFK